eukprot:11024875-Ditylum_brightwellii.AAC.1
MGRPSIVTPSMTSPSVYVVIARSSSCRVWAGRSQAASRWVVTVFASLMKAIISLMRSSMESWGDVERWA